MPRLNSRIHKLEDRFDDEAVDRIVALPFEEIRLECVYLCELGKEVAVGRVLSRLPYATLLHLANLPDLTEEAWDRWKATRFSAPPGRVG